LFHVFEAAGFSQHADALYAAAFACSALCAQTDSTIVAGLPTAARAAAFRLLLPLLTTAAPSASTTASAWSSLGQLDMALSQLASVTVSAKSTVRAFWFRRFSCFHAVVLPVA
jgi:hypothetical protein